MIRRNVASQVVYLPALRLTADGAAVTSGASIVVAKDGVESAGTGTLTHYSGGVWKYTPTQAETDAAIVALILTASGADPVVINLVTTAANTAAVALGANTTTPPTVAAFEARTLEASQYATAGSQTTILSRLGAWTGTGVNTILGALRAALNKAAPAPSDIGGTFDPATDSTEAIRDRGDAAWVTGSSSGTGTGARTVTITVNDGTNALQNAKVRLSEGANTFVGTTNASGVVTFNLDDASYTVAITKSGYSYAGTTLVVDGTETVTYSMTAVTITPGGDTGEVTGYFTVRDENNNPESGVTIYCRMTCMSYDSTGDAHDGANRIATSAGNGVVQFQGLLIGGTYLFWRGDESAARKVTIPDDDETQAGTYALPDIVGAA